MKWSEMCPKCGRKMHHRAACSPPPVRKRKLRPPSARTVSLQRAQDCGFGLALAICQREAPDASTYARVMDAYGLTVASAAVAGLEEYDLSQLRIIEKELNR